MASCVSAPISEQSNSGSRPRKDQTSSVNVKALLVNPGPPKLPKSKISGPIASHDVYENKQSSRQSVSSSRSRRKLDLGPLMPHGDNHIKDNIRRIRHIQLSARQRDEDAKQEPVKPTLPISERFRQVPSKLAPYLQSSLSRCASARPESARSVSYLRLPTGPTSEKLGSLRRAASAAAIADGVDKPDSRPASARLPTNHIGANIRKAAEAEFDRSKTFNDVEKALTRRQELYSKYKRGKMPTFMEELKTKRAEEATVAEANKPDPDCPKDHRKMSEEERRSTLAQLKQNQSELLHQLSSLPLVETTVRQRQFHEQLERKLTECEEAIKVFSKPKVFIKMDS